jgi:hypothetical protein
VTAARHFPCRPIRRLCLRSSIRLNEKSAEDVLKKQRDAQEAQRMERRAMHMKLDSGRIGRTVRGDERPS